MSEIQFDIIRLFPEVVLGAEDDDEPDPKPGTGDNSAAGGNPDSSKGVEEDEDDDNPAGDEEDGRLKALKAERKLKREAEAEAKRLKTENEQLKRAQMDDQQRTAAERDEAVTKLTDSEKKISRLAAGFRNTAIRNAVSAEAKKQNFIDTEDAIAGVDFEALGVEQDEEDPTQVTIDLKAVTSAVKKLATGKPHYINKGTNDGERTGSQFGGSRRKSGDEDENTLRERYPNL